ncbi:MULTISPECIES: dockerin type I domain-containing protein [unclassified Ruminococcus]|uniref:dockerin type I domain-containing protein n=1 Tax=unclassified Ruminococcus TaxID=2608920 RepID=UPI00210E61EC|nr:MULTISPECIES: dockerin type I domain-containing protein [unclassified Ruminococcus]MCQ4022063.1 hypothetical protein [Ruminococcus sp. zg-924]MCQ4114383.1 hypothetical protein [Ruminococcus sp. zg-921]
MKAIKKITTAAMSLILVLGIFATSAAAAPNEEKTVTVSIEAFSIGCGYVVEPTLISFNEGDTAATAVQKALEQKQIAFSSTNEYGFYLKGITFAHTDKIPSYILNTIIAHDDEYDEDILFGDYLDEDYTPNDLIAGDYYPLSGWMFSVNQPTAESLSLGLSQTKLNNGDVIRVQFSLDCGADIGLANLSGMPQWGYHSDFYETTDKTELTRVIGQSSATKPSPLYNSVEILKNTAANLPATKQEVDSVLSDYNTIARLNPITGDVDLSGSVSVKDAILIQKSSLEITSLDSVQALIADCNSDGSVNLSDAITVQKIGIGIV